MGELEHRREKREAMSRAWRVSIYNVFNTTRHCVEELTTLLSVAPTSVASPALPWCVPIRRGRHGPINAWARGLAWP